MEALSEQVAVPCNATLDALKELIHIQFPCVPADQMLLRRGGHKFIEIANLKHHDCITVELAPE